LKEVEVETVCGLDVWRAANLMVEQYSDRAAGEAAARCNAALEASDQANYDLWMRVLNAINSLQFPDRSAGKLN
jgi:hypothetical protein